MNAGKQYTRGDATPLNFSASDFSSRKLLDIAASAEVDEVMHCYRVAAVQELAQRRHYLTELADRGLISKHTHH